MQLKNHTYLFGKVPVEYQDEGTHFEHEGSQYYFKIVLADDGEIIRIHDTCDRMVPIGFENLCEIRDTFNKIINDVAIASVGGAYNDKS